MLDLRTFAIVVIFSAGVGLVCAHSMSEAGGETTCIDMDGAIYCSKGPPVTITEALDAQAELGHAYFGDCWDAEPSPECPN